MKNAARVLIALLFVAMTTSGLAIMFKPEAMLAHLAIAPDSVAGFSNLRALLGGAHLTFGALFGFAAWSARRDVLWVPTGYMGAVLLGRLVSFGVDGAHPFSYSATAFIGVLLAVAFAALALLRRSEANTPAPMAVRGASVA